MRWVLFAACAAVAATLWLPGEAAQPAPGATGDDKITFAQYRDWRDRYNERRRDEIASQLAAPNMTGAQKSRLEQVKAYYDWLTGLPEADRDRRYRERFDRIDTDHDGAISPAERAAWREQRRAMYRHRGTPQPEAASATTPAK